MSGDAIPAKPRRFWDWRPKITPAVELGVLALAVGMGIATYFVVRGGSTPQRLLTPPLVALLLVANLAPCVGLIMLTGRRIARRRAARSGAGGEGRLHVRLVALFAAIATVPTVLAVLFASVMFQYGVEFWLSDRVSNVLTNAKTVARESQEGTLTRWNGEALAAGADIAEHWGADALKRATNPANAVQERDQFGYSLPAYLGLQLYNRGLSEGALFTVTGNNQIQFIARVDPYGNAAEQIDPAGVISILRDGKPFINAKGNRIRLLSVIPGSGQIFLYAGKVTEGDVADVQLQRLNNVITDFSALQSRARALQLQFNAALFIVALLIVSFAMWIALVVADRVVSPVGAMVDAARRVADGDLTARVPDPETNDEVATLANAFNRMTGRLQEQTGALERRRALIEAVMSGVSAGVVSIGADGTVRLINASAAALLRIDAIDAVGAPLSEIAPELAQTISNNARDSIVEMVAGGEPRTLAVRITADEDGRVLTFDDITQQLLDQRRAAWSDVARRIAHEIKNPLTPIQLAAERLQRRYGKTIDAGDTTFAQLTDTIVRQVGDLRQIVDEFSSFARMPKPVFHAESLIDLTRQAVFLQEVSHPNITFSLDAPDAAPLVCDRRQIGQALTNIVKNAVEAIAAHDTGAVGAVAGTVEIRLTKGERLLTATIADNGIGLPVERDRIVEPYMTTRARGTGLGLAIVKKIIEEHCGTIAFSDRPGGGTIVTIQFDAVALDALLDEQPSPEETSLGEGALAMLTRTGQKP